MKYWKGTMIIGILNKSFETKQREWRVDERWERELKQRICYIGRHRINRNGESIFAFIRKHPVRFDHQRRWEASADIIWMSPWHIYFQIRIETSRQMGSETDWRFTISKQTITQAHRDQGTKYQIMAGKKARGETENWAEIIFLVTTRDMRESGVTGKRL